MASEQPPTIGEFYELLKQTTNMAGKIELPIVTDMLMRAEDEIKPLLEGYRKSRVTPDSDT